MENENLEISYPGKQSFNLYFLVLLVIFSIAILRASKKGVRISKYLKILDL